MDFMSNLNYVAISLAVLGVAYGISKIGSHAMDAIARQPEAADKVQAYRRCWTYRIDFQCSVHERIIKNPNNLGNTVGAYQDYFKILY